MPCGYGVEFVSNIRESRYCPALGPASLAENHDERLSYPFVRKNIIYNIYIYINYYCLMIEAQVAVDAGTAHNFDLRLEDRRVGATCSHFG